MKQFDKTPWFAVPISLLVAGVVGWCGGHGGVLWMGVPAQLWVVGLAFAMQWVAFAPAYLRQTERFFDLTGSLTYITVTGVALAVSPQRDARAVLLFLLVAVWAIRLGTFLVRRIRRVGKDERFEKIKRSVPRFLMTWTLQGLWVSLTLAAALAAILTNVRKPVGVFAGVGFGLWVLGFSIEAVADWQKRRFRSIPDNRGAFIQQGLWRWSRHPNYFGEILLWVGVAVIASPVLRGWQWVTMISPLFVMLLLTRISGIPMLEKRADQKWGGQVEYEAYKKSTSVLLPWFPKTPR